METPLRTHTLTLEGTLPHDREKTYVHLPFDVPDGAIRLDVEYDYSDRIGSDPRLAGGNTIDLGVFDERGIDFLNAGFRGWSGSEKKTFTITESEATPGYLAGPLNPGKWHVLLGLYKIAQQGCSYRATIHVTTEAGHQPAPPSAAMSGDLPFTLPTVSKAAPWLRGELHCHTLHSDGKKTAAALVDLARQQGLDFLAVSDHNTTACQRELETVTDPGLILIRGVEVTTFRGHFNVWGVPNWVDFRVQNPQDMAAALGFANQTGAVTSCGHPKTYGPPWEYLDITDHQCLEVWNGPWPLNNKESLARWLSLLAAGRRIPAVGGSDYHRPGDGESALERNLGRPTTWVYLPGKPSAAGILEAIRHGHVSLSAEPEGPFLELRGGENFSAIGGDVLPIEEAVSFQVRCLRGAGGILRLLDQNEVLLERELSAAEEIVECQFASAGSLYVRAELRTADERMLALTNPIYFVDQNTN